MTMKFTIPGELIDLNTYIQHERGNRFAAAKDKETETETVYWAIKQAHIQPIKKSVYVVFGWYCKNKRKDKDNISFAKKFIFDGMVKAGIIADDGWEEIEGFEDEFYVDKENPRIEVEII